MKQRINWEKMKGQIIFSLVMLIFLAGGGYFAVTSAGTGYEVSGINFDPVVTTGQPVKITTDLTVNWTEPAEPAKSDVQIYLIKISTSGASLTDEEFNITTSDIYIVDRLSLPTKVIPASVFERYNSETVYIHIKTQYDPGSGLAYSDDVVSAAIIVDNVAPGGAISLDPATGNTRQITITVSPDETIKTYWISESPTFPGGDGLDGATLTTDWELQNTTYGSVPIYAWFEDFAGNRSTAYTATANYTYTGIAYTSSTVEIGGTIGFAVDNVTSYTWTITDPSVDGVAEFSGGGTAPVVATSVSVVGMKVGTFTVTATPAAGDPLKTGTITVTQTYILGDVDGNGLVDLSDVIKIARASLGKANTGTFIAAASDINKDGVIDLSDVIKAARLSLGKSI